MTPTTLPTDSLARKDIPLASGLLDYFPAALAEVAKVSKAGNDKHNPGQPLHHSRGKSGDHADCVVRHLVERGTIDPDDNQRHTAKLAWRALALLQEELEAAGATMARAAWVDVGAPTASHVHVCADSDHDAAAGMRLTGGRPEYAPGCRCACGLAYGQDAHGWLSAHVHTCLAGCIQATYGYGCACRCGAKMNHEGWFMPAKS